MSVSNVLRLDELMLLRKNRKQASNRLRFLPTVSLIVLCGCPGDEAQQTLSHSTSTNLQGEAAAGALSGGGNTVLNRVTLAAVADWTVKNSTDDRIIWAGAPGNTYTLTYHEGESQLPLDDIDALRQSIRKLAAAEQGGIVQVDTIIVDGYDAAYFLTKDTVENSMGYRYVGRCVIPVDGGWYEMRVDAVETGPTGQREAFITVQLGIGANVEYEEIPPTAPPTPGSTGRSAGRRIKGWYKDPYDPEFDAMASYSDTDDVKYDAKFRKHALSRIRATFPDIVSSIQIANSEDATSAD
jgi:hypothetical protein